MRKFFVFFAAFFVVGLYAMSGKMSSPFLGSSLSDLQVSNLSALSMEDTTSMGGGNMNDSISSPGSGIDNDKPDTYPYIMTCNYPINWFQKCTVTIIVCIGGGNGCTPVDCPKHPRFSK